MNQNTRIALLAAAGLGAVLGARALRRRDRWSFYGRVVFITGGSRGLGLVLARHFAAEGAQIAICARDAEELSVAANELQDYGTRVIAFVCDVRDQQAIQGGVARVIEQFGRLDVLVNNAGVIQSGPIDHMGLEDFSQALDTHLWGPLYAMMAAIPQMRLQGEGRIVNIASIGGLVSVPHLVPYSTSKFALVGLSDGMRAELARDNIQVTTVCPGLMRTGSHVNAQFKGQHEREYAWFSIFDSLPISSIDAREAARAIVEATRRGDAQLTISLQARLIAAFDAMFPDLNATLMQFVNARLPDSTTAEGDQIKSGWESRSAWAPPLLTSLADKASVRNNEL